MNNRFHFAAGLLLAALPPSTTLAAVEAEPVVVTATRTAQSFDATLAPVIVIDRDEIEANPGADAVELLRLHTGLEISRNGGPGQPASVFLRGTDSNHALVMIDGVKINPGTIGGAALQNIRLEGIERIEVVKGPRSTLYGSDAIGGVIHLITRRDGEGAARARFGAGRYGSHEAALSIHRRRGGSRAGISANALRTDGFPTRTTSNLARGYTNRSLRFYAGRRLGELDAEFSHWQAAGTSEYLDFFLNPLDQDYRNSATALTLSGALSDTWAGTLKLSRMTDRVDQNQGGDFTHTRRNQIDWQNDIQLNEHHLLSAGLYVTRERTGTLSWGTGFSKSTGVTAVYLQDDFTRGPHHLVAGARLTDHETFGRESTWDLEYGYQATPRLRITAAANTGFRAPDSTDRFGFGGNPDLKAETSRNLELGLRFRPGARQTLALNLYRNRIDNLIEYFDPDGWAGPAAGRMQNIGRARIEGTELTYDARIGHWRLRAGTSLQDPVNEDDGSPLLRRAGRTLNLGGGYDSGPYRLAADLVHSGERSGIGGVTLDAYTLVNLNGMLRLGRGCALAARLENAFDEDYVLADGYNTPGRSLFLELRYRTE